MAKHIPVEFLHSDRVTDLVGIGKGVAFRSRSLTQGSPLADMESNRITNLIETVGTGQMSIEQSQYLAPERELAHLDFELLGQILSNSFRKVLHQLPQNAIRTACWPIS